MRGMKASEALEIQLSKWHETYEFIIGVAELMGAGKYENYSRTMLNREGHLLIKRPICPFSDEAERSADIILLKRDFDYTRVCHEVYGAVVRIREAEVALGALGDGAFHEGLVKPFGEG